MPKFVMLIAFLVPFPALAEDMAPQEVQAIASKFNETMMKCPGKIWPDYTWNNLRVVLLYPKKDHSWIWDATTNTTQRINNSSLPSSAIGSSYEFFEVDGRSSMSLNMEEENKEVFQLGVHEFFHHYGQKNWTSGQVNGGRGTEYPVSWQPRLYRRMIFDSLKKYLEAGRDSDLAQARFWYDKWTNEYPNETKSTTDGYEGTAEYADIMAEVIAKTGCSGTDEQLRAQVVNEVKTNFGFSVSGQHFGLDSKGYEVGGLSALILRFRNNNLSEWTHRMSKGDTPLQVLMESTSSASGSAGQDLISTFRDSAHRINAERAPLLDHAIAAWPDKSYVRVPTPYNWLQSNLMPKFFAKSTQIGMSLYPLSTDHHYISPDGRSNFKLKANAVVFSHYTAACQNQYSFTLVPASLVQFTNGTTSISSPSFHGVLQGRITVDEQGYQYLCVE